MNLRQILLRVYIRISAGYDLVAAELKSLNLRTPPRNDSWTAKVRHLDRLKQTPLPSVRQLEKLAWRPA